MHSCFMNRRPKGALRMEAVLLLLAWALGGTPAAMAASYEAKMFAITQWTSECSGSERPSWDDMATAWYDEVTRHGVFYKDGRLVNGSMSLRRFCDEDGPGVCNDNAYVDDADAALLALHGGDKDNHWRGKLRVLDSNNECRLDAAEGTAIDDLFVGDQDLEFLHLSSCNSMNDNNINFTARSFQNASSATSGSRLHQMNGFHGLMYIGPSYIDDYRDFAEEAHDVPLHIAWLDTMYRSNVGDGDEQCPVSFAIGSTRLDALNRLKTERYSHILSEPGGANAWAYSFFEGCDPTALEAFNDPND
jgi:hypothetical protein